MTKVDFSKNFSGQPICLWSKNPPLCLGKTKQADKKKIFPSGRQAISYGLKAAGLQRFNRVAFPEWSSHCVISAIGQVATPVPIKEALKNGEKVDAVLFYEQWGWPLAPESKTEIQRRFKKAIIILDRVDSADIDNKNRMKFFPRNKQIDIISLSKVLGLAGGGFLKINGRYLDFLIDEADKKLGKIFFNKEENKILSDIAKSYICLLPPELESWLSKNNLHQALREEGHQRRENLKKLLVTSLVKSWPKWMFSAIERGAAPGIAPLFKGKKEKEMEKIKKQLKDKFNLACEMYHFNWSGNPMKSDYKKCLAFPIHGSVKSIDLILDYLAKQR
jgi:hypothetical protein